MRLRCLLTGFPFGNMQLDGDKAAASITCVPGKSPAAPVGRLGHCVSTPWSAVHSNNVVEFVVIV